MKHVKTLITRQTPLLAASLLLALSLTGCTAFEQSGIADGFRYVGNGIGKGYSAIQSLENSTVGAVRSSYLGDSREKTVPAVQVSTKSLYMKTYADGSGFSARTIDTANAFLRSQGPLAKQVITVVPRSPEALGAAKRLGTALEDAGAKSVKVAAFKPEATSGEEKVEDRDTGAGVEIISETYLLTVPDCTVANPARAGIDPYFAMGALGCANNANIARMVSDPRDLVRPRPLEPGDGEAAVLAVRKYQTGDTEDLVDIDFSQDE